MSAAAVASGPARWIFARAPENNADAVALGPERTLVIDGHRRALRDPSGLREAETILPFAARTAAALSGRQTVFLGSDGVAMVTDGPLGKLLRTTPMREPPRAVAAHERDLFAIGRLDATLQRSSDGGVSWSSVAFSPIAGLAAHDVAIDASGKGLLLAMPQRLFRTDDGGATWAPLLGDGASVHAVLAADGQLYVDGQRGLRALTPSGDFRAATAAERDRVKPAARSRWDAPLRAFVLAGDLVLRVNAEKPAHAWIGPIDGAPSEIPADPFAKCTEIVGAGAGVHVVFGCFDREAQSLTRIVSDDGGKSFAISDPEYEVDATPKGPLAIVARSGAILLGATCFDPTRVCGHARYRAAPGAPWVTLDGPAQLVGGWFEPDGARLVAVVDQEGGAQRFVDVAVGALPAGWSSDGHDIDDVAAVGRASDGRPWALRNDGADGTHVVDLGSPKRPVGAPLPFTPSKLAIAGPRAIAIDGGGRAWETADAGKSWGPVVWPGVLEAARIECASGGCAGGGWLRVGWDLPGHADGAEVVAPSRTLGPSAAAHEPLSIGRCEPANKALGVQEGAILSTGGDREPFVIVDDATRASDVTLVGPAGLRRVSLLPTVEPKSRSHRFVGHSPDGVVAVRYALVGKPSDAGGYLPVEVWLGWLDVTGRPRSAHIPTVPPFRVPFRMGGPGAALEVVPGGVHFGPYGLSETYFARDDGKIEKLMGFGGRWEATAHGPLGLLTIDRDYGEIAVRFAPPGSTNFEASELTLDESSHVGASLFAADDGIVVLDAPPDGERGVLLSFPIAPPPKEAPAPRSIVMPFGGALPPRCEERDRKRAYKHFAPPKGVEWRVDLATGTDGAALHAKVQDLLVRLTAAGGWCAEALVARTADATLMLPLADPEHSFSRADADAKISAARCSIRR